ncbi:nuclear cap-binding protein subunit 3 [Bicyclus anynana]|uniref:Nuclear cap-binding protein subunit 3 n=1 Tax=Bicyclus anynana TaxID=110368 RepID=A0A6J1NL56_BICAN|nr:nuclear cap-binding protein subunit 3 [Bicyclus anynana]
MDHDKEEGEMSDDTEMVVDDQREVIDYDTKQCTVLYTADKNGPLVKKLNKVDASKLEERARRFGLDLSGNRVVTQTQIDELYNNFGIESGNERHFRFDTLHLNGVHGLSTKDIFEYLEDYKPVSLEWIDDNSCNVVCQDDISVALALLVHSREIKNKDIINELHAKSTYHWREGMPHPKKDIILMRFATNGDKKMCVKMPEPKVKDDDNYNNVGKNPWGDLCRSWGVYDHQEVFQRKLPKIDQVDEYSERQSEVHQPVQIKNKRLAMRLGKRSIKTETDDDESSSDSEWKTKSKTPRMRMHADDEESKQRKLNITKLIKTEEEDSYAPLSIEVINSRTTFTPRETKKISEKFKYRETQTSNLHKNIQSRLGVKVTPDKQTSSSDESSSDDSDHNVVSRVQKVTSNSKNSSDVWSRLERVPQNITQKDLRQVLKTRKQKPDDLRGKIGKSKQCNLRIEIDNNYNDE